MPTSWIDSVKQTGQLSVFPGPTVTGGAWATVFNEALLRFNALSQLLAFGVTVVRATTPPSSNGSGGADVQFEAGSNQVSYTFQGAQYSMTIDGNGVGGNTQVVKISINATDYRIAKAFIFVPATPKVGGGTGRQVGRGPRLVIAVHELIHAAGLSNADHSPSSKPDVFYGYPQLDDGKTAADDRIRLPDNRILPPIWMANETARNIAGVW